MIRSRIRASACAAWRRAAARHAEQARAERRYLNRHPKARLYAGFADFAFFRLAVERASLNGGFGKAYHLTRGRSHSRQPANRGTHRCRAAGDRPYECRPWRRGRRLCARLCQGGRRRLDVHRHRRRRHRHRVGRRLPQGLLRQAARQCRGIARHTGRTRAPGKKRYKIRLSSQSVAAECCRNRQMPIAVQFRRQSLASNRAGRLQSIRANSCSRAARNRGHPALAPR